MASRFQWAKDNVDRQRRRCSSSSSPGAVFYLADVAIGLAVLAAVPNPGNGKAPPGTEKLLTLLQWAAWIGLFACVLGIIICGGTIAVQHRSGGGMSDAGSRVGAVMIGCILIGSASAIVAVLT